MGTGILALVLGQIAGAPDHVLWRVGHGLWLVNIGFFIVFAGLYGARWLFYGKEAQRIFGHNVVSMFIGAIPMGLSTLISGAVVFGVPSAPDWAPSIVQIAFGFWWLDVVMSVCCGAFIPYLMFTRQEHSIDQMTGVWLLPVVAAEVCAASGGVLAPHLASADWQFVTLVTSYAMWAYSVPVAFSILAILLLRLALHKLPQDNMAASIWLALGPISTGALGMLIMGNDAPAIFSPHGLALLGDVAHGGGILAAIVLWGCGLWWFMLANLITWRYFRKGIPFNLGWWGYTFPLGVFTLVTLKLADVLDVLAFHYVGVLLACLLCAMWCVVFYKTVIGAWRGTLFVAPCLTCRLPTDPPAPSAETP
jgi:C4-dicarboxylate transporter/malic acid transport protein